MSKDLIAATLDEMARNYADENLWDDLDREAVCEAASIIREQEAEIAKLGKALSVALEALEDKIDAADEMKRREWSLKAEIEKGADDLADALARVAVLEAALEPFANLEILSDYAHESDSLPIAFVADPDESEGLRLAHFRTARAALSGKE